MSITIIGSTKYKIVQGVTYCRHWTSITKYNTVRRGGGGQYYITIYSACASPSLSTCSSPDLVPSPASSSMTLVSFFLGDSFFLSGLGEPEDRSLRSDSGVSSFSLRTLDCH